MTTKRVKVTDLKGFVEACKASSDAERIGGMLVDLTTKSMISQVWDSIQKHEKAEEFIDKLSNRFNNIIASHNIRVAIVDLVDRFWKIARK
jgi:acyl carrier protein phosphodiesterase